MKTSEKGIKKAGKGEEDDKSLVRLSTKAEFKEWEASFDKTKHNMQESKALFMRECWMGKTREMFTHVDGCKSLEDYVKLKYPGWMKGFTTVRESIRIYGAFMKQAKNMVDVKKLEDTPEKTDKIIEVTDRVLGNLWQSVNFNESYLDVVSRTNVMGETKKDTDMNVNVIKQLATNANKTQKGGGVKGFEKEVRKKFGLISEARSKGQDKRTDRGPAKVPGQIVSLSMQLDPSYVEPITSAFNGTAEDAGIRKTFANMNSKELGGVLHHICALRNDDVALNGDGNQREVIKTRARQLVNALYGQKISDENLEKMMGEISPIVEKWVAKA